MRARLLSAVVFAAALAGGTAPAVATDTSSLSAFLAGCSTDTKSCHSFAEQGASSAKSANYGCIPASLSAEEAGNQLLDWMKGPASADPKYKTMSLEDVMWDGVDALWPCHK